MGISLKTNWVFVFLLLSVLGISLGAQDKVDEPPVEPEVISIFPLGGQQGEILEVEIRGRTLEEAYAIWFDTEGLEAQVKTVEEIELDEKKDPKTESEKSRSGHRVFLQVQISAAARIGPHSLWLVSPRGVSNTVPFWVHADPVMVEGQGPHDTPEQAQWVRFPVVVNGKLSQPGELDYYAFESLPGGELTFELISEMSIDPRLALYEQTGSWFDRHRTTQLAFSFDDDNTTTKPQFRYRFKKKGRYLMGVESFSAKGGPDCFYQIRIAPRGYWSRSEGKRGFAQVVRQDWRERDFTRKIAADRLEVLRSRTVRLPTTGVGTDQVGSSSQIGGSETTVDRKPVQDLSTLLTIPSVVMEREPNETVEQALEVSVPALIEGTIDRPEDVDSFKFKVKGGDKLALEIQTPQAIPPYFNPRVGILDTDGREFLTNVYKRLGRQFQFYLKTVEPKTVYTFELGGEYTLQIRDITSKYGDSSFLYRLLIRPQIPHVGEIQLKEERVNLVPGEARKLTVITEQEEGYGGEIALSVENLPPGVQAFPATEVEPDRGINPDEGEKERFVAKTQKATIVLMAEAHAPVTTEPHFFRIVGRPIIEGRPGPPLSSTLAPERQLSRPALPTRLVELQEIPLMVVRREGKSR